MSHREKFRSGRIIVIPDVVVNHLEVPKTFAGAGVQREQAVAEQIGPRAVGPVKVVFGASRRHINDPASLVQRKFAPTISAANGLPCVLRPCVISELARMRDGMKTPDQLTRAYVIGANIAGSGSVPLVCRRPEHKQIFKNSP